MHVLVDSSNPLGGLHLAIGSIEKSSCVITRLYLELVFVFPTSLYELGEVKADRGPSHPIDLCKNNEISSPTFDF